MATLSLPVSFRPRRRRPRFAPRSNALIGVAVVFLIFILHRVAVHQQQSLSGQAEDGDVAAREATLDDQAALGPPAGFPPPDLTPGLDLAPGFGLVEEDPTNDWKAPAIPIGVLPPTAGGSPPGDTSAIGIPDRGDYHELYSLTTRNQEFIPIFFEGVGTTNPSIVPHPDKHNMWIIVVDRLGTNDRIACTAGVLDDIFICTEFGQEVSSAVSLQLGCGTKPMNFNRRVSYGPENVFSEDGLFAEPSCTGLWIQDARMLLNEFHFQTPLVKKFRGPTRLQSPETMGENENNFFLFWDRDNKPYVQYALWPTRRLAELSDDGKMGEDLGTSVWKQDRICMAKYMPEIESMSYEWIQQGTNSLSITLCKRKDENCKPNDSNTFIMHIFNHVLTYDDHVIHEPYVVLFKQSAPFGFHAVSQRPIWISGRTTLTSASGSMKYLNHPEEIPPDHWEDFRVTSISWKSHYQKYHGHIDDNIWLAFTIEESRSAVIDIRVGELMEDLGYC